ncbi:MAG: type II secretion system protein GspG [Candidatus Roizmanbacteria bacterium]|nr:MAG: type II secretion system protein GspG [Candidatus Roizmanbacteria bacterium]
MKNRLKGFTLLELMIVIAILGILASFISGNLINSLKKGRDARRKSDLEQIQRALELYYEDNKSYPALITAGSQITHPSVANKVYMQRVPDDPASNNDYTYVSSGTNYKIYSCIENTNDNGPGVTTYSVTCGDCGNCKYGVSSSNTLP